jgi:hypothetical protein
MKLVTVAVLAVLLAGCTRTVDATPQPEPPPRLDCNLIFPGPGGA